MQSGDKGKGRERYEDSDKISQAESSNRSRFIPTESFETKDMQPHTAAEQLRKIGVYGAGRSSLQSGDEILSLSSEAPSESRPKRPFREMEATDTVSDISKRSRYSDFGSPGKNTLGERLEYLSLRINNVEK